MFCIFILCSNFTDILLVGHSTRAAKSVMGSKIKLDQCTIERLKFVFLSVNISDYIAVFNNWRQFNFSVQCLLHLEIYINEGVVYTYIRVHIVYLQFAFRIVASQWITLFSVVVRVSSVITVVIRRRHLRRLGVRRCHMWPSE